MPTFQDSELLPEHEILQYKIPAATEDANQCSDPEEKQAEHGMGLYQINDWKYCCKLLILRSARVLARDRAHQGTAPELEARNYWLPQPQWAEEFIEECAAFPNRAHDDQVDTWSQAAARFRGFYTGIMDYYRVAAFVVDAGKTSETPAELLI